LSVVVDIAMAGPVNCKSGAAGETLPPE